jgi:glucose-1-phosphatase
MKNSTSQPTVDALVFDGGGVLIEIDFRRAVDYWARAAGVSADAISRRFKFDASYEAHEKGEIDAHEYFASLRQSLAIDLTDAEFAAGWCDIFVGPIPGAFDLLRDLSLKLPVYLFSNTNLLHYNCWSKRYPEVLSPLSAGFYSHVIGQRKPSLEAFSHVAAAIGLAPQRIAFFDDLPENIEGARCAGFKGFCVKSTAEILAVLNDDLHISTD